MKKSRKKKESTHAVEILDLLEICKRYPEVIPVIRHIFATLGPPVQPCEFYYCCGRRA
jgi:hypothetical protein